MQSLPNFLIQAILNTYVTQEVFVPQEEEEPPQPTEGSLIDTSDFSQDQVDSHKHESVSPGPSPSYLELVTERDNLIKHLQMETERLR